MPGFFGGQLFFSQAKAKPSALSLHTLQWPTSPQFQLRLLAQPDSLTEGRNIMANSKLRGQANLGAAFYLPASQKVWFTQGQVVKNQKDKQTLTLYSAKVNDHVWYSMEALPLGQPDYSVAHPSLSPDGLRLFFASDAPGGLGGSDLYVCELDTATGRWGEPRNLGSPVNSLADELYPFIHEDGNLYFSSNREGSLGGLDIYEAVVMPDRETYIRVANLGAPVNSVFQDFGFIIDPPKRRGYFTSDRVGGPGGYDLYLMDVRLLHYSRNLSDTGEGMFAKLTLDLFGTVRDSSTNQPIRRAAVRLRDLNRDDSKIVHTDEQGQYQFKIWNEHKYQITVGKLGFQTGRDEQFSTYGLTEAARLEHDFFLTAIKYKLTLKVNVLEKAEAEGPALPIPLATIWLEDTQSGETQQVTTDSLGRQVFNLQQGRIYKLVADAHGFAASLPYRISTDNTTNSRTVEINVPLTKTFERRNAFYLKIVAEETLKKAPLAGAEVSLKEFLPQKGTQWITDGQGITWVEVDTTLRKHWVEAAKIGYQQPRYVLADFSQALPGDTLTIKLGLRPSKLPPVPLSLVPPAVQYPAGAGLNPVVLTEKAKAIAALLKQYPSVKIALHGHADLGLPKAQAQAVSQQWANAVKAALLKQKVAPQRIVKVVAHGKARPLHDCRQIICSEGQKRENRRVEIEIVER
ncbi:MAG: OmpA family protein [Bernardetiaceae bacterium]|nr:OmpA family protein [Bernardetiaceae bacterium]